MGKTKTLQERQDEHTEKRNLVTEVKKKFDLRILDAMSRTGFWRCPNPKDNTVPFSNNQTIARAMVLQLEELEKEILGVLVSQ